MKKIISVLMILLTISAGFVFAESASTDPFDSLIEKLLKDFDDSGATVAVKVFNSDLGNNERKKISKSVQFSLYCADVLFCSIGMIFEHHVKKKIPFFQRKDTFPD